MSGCLALSYQLGAKHHTGLYLLTVLSLGIPNHQAETPGLQPAQACRSLWAAHCSPELVSALLHM